MQNNNLQFLNKVSDILISDFDISQLALELKNLLSEYVNTETLAFYIFDNVTNTMRDCVNSWSIVEDESEIYKNFEKIKEHDFVINLKAYKLPAVISDITLKIESLSMPITKEGKVFGLIEIKFDENTSVNMEFLFLM